MQVKLSPEAALIAIVGFYLVPIWTLESFPTQDGPSHLYNAYILLDLAAGSESYQPYFEPSWKFVPNWLGALVLLSFGNLGMLEIGERFLLSIILVVFSGGFARWTKDTSESMPAVALLGPAFALSTCFFLGFHSYMLGFALVPWVWSFARELARRWESRTAVRLVSVLAFTSLAHVVPLMLCIMGILWFSLIESLAQTDRGPFLRGLAISILPLALIATFVLSQQERTTYYCGLPQLIGHLLVLDGLVSYPKSQQLFASIIASISIFFLTIRLREGARPHYPYLGLAGLCLFLYFWMPEAAVDSEGRGTHGFLSLRLGLYPWIALAPLLNWPKHEQRLLLIYPILCAALLFSTVDDLWRGSKVLTAYRALGEHISPKQRILSLQFCGKKPIEACNIGQRGRPTLHAVSLIAMDRSLVNIGNYEPGTDHFQVKWAPGIQEPSQNVLNHAPETLDLYAMSPQLQPDYLVTWGLEKNSPKYRDHIQRGYSTVIQQGHLELFSRTGDSEH